MTAKKSGIRECLGGFDKSNVKKGGEMEWSGVETPLWHGPVSTPSSHRYGDHRMFSLIIGNCEPVSVPAHRYTYSYFNDTCQRSRLLQDLMSSTATAKEMCSGAYVWSCTHTHTHTHTHTYRSLQLSGVNRLEVIRERGLKEKSFDKESVSLSPLDKTKAYAL